MNITNILKESFLQFITKLLQLFSKFNPQPLSSGDALDPDLATGDDTVGVDPVEVPAEAAGLVVVHHHIHNMDCADLMIGFCLSAALEMASLYTQIGTQLSATFHWLSLAIGFAFACFFVSQFIKSKSRFLATAQVLQKFGEFFAVTAFFMAITIPSPPYFKFATWTIYAISVLTIIICNCL